MNTLAELQVRGRFLLVMFKYCVEVKTLVTTIKSHGSVYRLSVADKKSDFTLRVDGLAKGQLGKTCLSVALQDKGNDSSG